MGGYTIAYFFRLIDQFTPGSSALVAAAGRIKASVAGAGAAMTGLVRGAALAGAALGGLLTVGFLSASSAAADFERALANVRKVVPDMTKDQMWAIGDRIQGIAVETGLSAERVAEITAAAARAGLRGTETLEKMTRMAAKVAVAWDDVSAEVATTSLTFLSGKFFPEMESNAMMDRMVCVADAINYLGQTSRGAKPDQILKFFDNAGADLARFGLSAEESAAFASTALMAGQGFGGLNEGTRAASSLSRLMSAASNPSKKQFAALKKLGLSRKELKRLLETDAAGALLSIMERTQGMDKITKQGVLEDLIGDKRAGRQLARMTDRINEFKRTLATVSDEWAQRLVNEKDFMSWMRTAYPEQAALLERTRHALHRGSVDWEFEALMDNLVKQSERFAAARGTLAQNIGKPLLDPLTGLTRNLADATGWLSRLTDEYQTATGYLAGGAMLSSILALGAGMLSFTAWATGFASSLALLAGLAKLSLVLTVTTVGIASAMWIYDNWEKLAQYASEEIEFRVLFPDMPDWLKDFMSRFETQAAERRDQAARTQRWASDTWDWLTGQEKPAQLVDPNDRLLFNWDNVKFGNVPTVPGLSPSAIPQGVSVSTHIDPIQINPAQLTVKYEGPILGPNSVPLSASAPRGVSNVEGGSTTPSTSR